MAGEGYTRGAIAGEIRREKAGGEGAANQDALIVVANSSKKDLALEGLERWKTKHANLAGFLAVGRHTSRLHARPLVHWTRIRVNLRHVPEDLRPAQETPDPDDDPTREWRASREKKSAGPK
jgi:hypothetical protein